MKECNKKPTRVKNTGELTMAEIQNAAINNIPLSRKEIAKVMRVSVDVISRLVSQGMPCYYLGEIQESARGAKPIFLYQECITWVKKRNENYRGSLFSRKVA